MECTKVIEGEKKSLKQYKAGDVFGELALLYNALRAAAVVATEDSQCRGERPQAERSCLLTFGGAVWGVFRENANCGDAVG